MKLSGVISREHPNIDLKAFINDSMFQLMDIQSRHDSLQQKNFMSLKYLLSKVENKK